MTSYQWSSRVRCKRMKHILVQRWGMQRFDPFGDRTARDIRNSLSSALVSDLCGRSDRQVERMVRHWIRNAGDASYRSYVLDCRVRYARVQDRIRSDHLTEPRLQAVVLWNAGLFFEMHELLETIWLPSQGDERLALKGLIQAAGAYVHQQRGKTEAALRLTQRARRNIGSAPEALAFIRNLDQLLRCLEDPRLPVVELLLNGKG